jgi:hypothetical protein
MASFLEILADELLKREKFSGYCIVFPSRRAGIFFKQVLTEKISKPIWAPAVMGIQDLISSLSPSPVAEKLPLLFDLYECYSASAQEESFDRFYPWGTMLLKDFDEIDRNLVETDHLFRILREHKEVEEEFEFSPAESDAFRRFWKTFSNKDLSEFQKEFINTWGIIGKVYHSFRKKLNGKNICYEGMAYRRIYELLRSKELKINYDKIIFAGFNQLNKAEEHIIKELIKTNKAEIFWDADNYYTGNKEMEAGKFMSKNFINLQINDPKWIKNDLSKSEKQINIIGAVLQGGQAKALGSLLENIKDTDIERTAVILPDESMLQPVIHSIPDNVQSLNITMGYSFKNSLLYSFIIALKNLQYNKKGEGSKAVYYYKNCEEVLSHPYLKMIASDKCFRVINDIRNKNIIYISRARIKSTAGGGDDIFDKIFTGISAPEDVLDYIKYLLSFIDTEIEKTGSKLVFEREFFFELLKELNNLGSIGNLYDNIDEDKTIWNLITEVMDSISIPFTGEPLKGLQVMGLLETRALDFDNIYILSMNEGTVPLSGRGSSYIPYHLRKAFGMPVYEDDDASFAYYFYRLLHKAKNINLIYNTETSGLISGEKSRFILQIQHELSAYNKNIKINEFIFQPKLKLQKENDIAINKTDKILTELENHVYSATALSNYIACSLRFYFLKIARLKADKTVEEAFSGASFGNLLHEIMSSLYGISKNTDLTAETIKKIKTNLEKNFDGVWENVCNKLPDLKEFAKELYGKNLLFKNVIKKLVGIILDNDIEQAPFKIIDVEGSMNDTIDVQAGGKNYRIKLTGRLDRVEEKDGITRIVDYKTGSFKMKEQKKNTEEQYFDNVFSDPDYKEAFQQYFYAMMYSAAYPGKKINAGIYPLRAASGGIEFYEDEGSFISKEKSDIYRNNLAKLFGEILDANIPFIKTEDTTRCQYCDFISICYRE